MNTNKPFVTLVHSNISLWKLLVIYDADNIYYSGENTHSELRNFKYPHHIEICENEIILHSKNNKNLIILKKIDIGNI